MRRPPCFAWERIVAFRYLPHDLAAGGVVGLGPDLLQSRPVPVGQQLRPHLVVAGAGAGVVVCVN